MPLETRIGYDFARARESPRTPQVRPQSRRCIAAGSGTGIFAAMPVDAVGIEAGIFAVRSVALALTTKTTTLTSMMRTRSSEVGDGGGGQLGVAFYRSFI